MQAGIPVTFEDCPNGRTFTGRFRACKCGRCRLCGFPKHSAIHGGVMGHEGENIVWGHEFKPTSFSAKYELRPTSANRAEGRPNDASID